MSFNQRPPLCSSIAVRIEKEEKSCLEQIKDSCNFPGRRIVFLVESPFRRKPDYEREFTACRSILWDA
jgi:hypothetical protein